ncbi:MAG: PAS domain S-box protein [Acidobacteriales bacterium]|nr:PAS domain S-box protein [Terriglobales bacterium]
MKTGAGRNKYRERLAAVVESSDDAIISKTLQGIITAWNHGAEKMFGYSAAEAIGQRMLMLIPEERLDEEASILERINRGQTIDHFETVRVRKDGSRIDISATISAIRDSNGAIVGAAKIARNITERRQAEEARRESEESFQAMANGIPQLAWMAAPDGGIFWYNQRWYDYTGTTADQMMGWGWQSVHDPQILPAVMQRWTRAIAGGTPFEMEFPLRGADGSFNVFLTRILPVKDSGGHVVRWFGTNTDVSQRTRADLKIEAQARELADSYEALERQTLMLQSVLDSMTEGLVAVDEQGKFIIWNVMAENLLGLGATDLPAELWNQHYGLFMNDTVTPFPTEQMPVMRALRGEASRTEMFVRNPQIPEGGWIEVYAGPRQDKDGVIRGGVAAFRDITKLKADEREIRRLNQKLEKRVEERTTQLEAANKHLAGHLTDQIRFKDEFLSHVSHELRSPLTAIKQFTSILREGMAGALSAEQKGFLDIVFRNIVQLQAMIDDLLEISRMESGKLTMHPVTMSVLDAVTDACDTLRLSAAAKGVTLAWDPPSGLPSITADPTRLRQILIILIDNAVKFTPPGGAIKIEVRFAPDDPQFLVVEISDSGCGMSAEASNKVFERLYQVSDSGQTRKGLGTRLIHLQRVGRPAGRPNMGSQPAAGRQRLLLHRAGLFPGQPDCPAAERGKMADGIDCPGYREHNVRRPPAFAAIHGGVDARSPRPGGAMPHAQPGCAVAADEIWRRRRAFLHRGLCRRHRPQFWRRGFANRPATFPSPDTPASPSLSLIPC